MKPSVRITLAQQSLDSAEIKNRINWLKGHIFHIILQAQETSNTWCRKSKLLWNAVVKREKIAMLFHELAWNMYLTNHRVYWLNLNYNWSLKKYIKKIPQENYHDEMVLMWEGEVKNLCRSVPRKYAKQEQIHASSAKTRSIEYFERSISKFPKDCHMLSQIEHPMNSVRSERGGKEYEWLRQGQSYYTCCML